MNRFPFLTFLKLQSAPRKARAFSGMAVGGFCDHQGTFSRMLPSTQLLHRAGVSTAVRRWGEVAGLHMVGMRFPKRFQETVFLQDAARGRGKEWILWLTTKSGKFQLTAVRFQRPAPQKHCYGGAGVSGSRSSGGFFHKAA